MPNSSPAIFLMGPTASGKTASAIHLLESGLPVELISVDSALVFKDMDIGSAKPSADELARAPHHLIDIISPEEAYSAAQFRRDALALMADITARGKVPVLVGGTMLYYNTLQHGIHELHQADAALRAQIHEEAALIGWPAMHAKLASIDPVTAERLKSTDAQRIERALEICTLTGKKMSDLLAEPASGALPYRLLKIALLPQDRKWLHDRIALRFDQMLELGLLDEVSRLRAKYNLSLELPSMRCVGYRQAWEYQDGLVDYPTMREKGIAATRQLAKRQLTWLRGMDDLLEMNCQEENLAERVKTAIEGWL
ncbi:tRNA (adenosine(37)-N6)-dimethylallyltransferase MiaA [Iodobacter sp. LRB]|uniref:tRNA (adenosine(37)-N6)-dimethylallyltransferase MiaA n=1 Tax=unclassified Iodobacter TaxID=235634 RepID=UPI000C0E2C0D|nr:tRNA (adenosine(37)-N6)-dimethylallyltransferase MiaA [Iodobacter sp. BJB302]PHV02392.1 tRNA (adenosine(37)-N6)-dimethylallyltransferase MiaA [Iodobacter sp. BJB302]